MDLINDLRTICGNFLMEGRWVHGESLPIGHINDTYIITMEEQGGRVRYVVQRINERVFTNPVALMENIQRVTEHLRRKLTAPGAYRSAQQALTLIPARNGLPFFHDEHGRYWRIFNFVEGARTYEIADSPAKAREAARAFGHFQQLLADLPPPRLHETIPDFHNTPRRFEDFEKALHVDALNRSAAAKREIDSALSRKAITGRLVRLQQEGKIPERVTHNDTKFNNVLLDDATEKAVCVLDLDTVMPGLALYDFGDMVRTTTSPAPEDETNLDRVQMRMPIFEALVDGYLETTGAFLNASEKKHLVFSGKLITFETGLRFLTDYLAGDTYFKVHREGHNLDRCRVQFKLVENIEEQEEAMDSVVDQYT